MSAEPQPLGAEEVAQPFYIAAHDSLVDEPPRTLKHGDTFALFDHYGDLASRRGNTLGPLSSRHALPLAPEAHHRAAQPAAAELDGAHQQRGARRRSHQSRHPAGRDAGARQGHRAPVAHEVPVECRLLRNAGAAQFRRASTAACDWLSISTRTSRTCSKCAASSAARAARSAPRFATPTRCTSSMPRRMACRAPRKLSSIRRRNQLLPRRAVFELELPPGKRRALSVSVHCRVGESMFERRVCTRHARGDGVSCAMRRGAPPPWRPPAASPTRCCAARWPTSACWSPTPNTVLIRMPACRGSPPPSAATA